MTDVLDTGGVPLCGRIQEGPRLLAADGDRAGDGGARRESADDRGLVRWPFLSSGRLVATLVGWGIWIAYATNPPSEAAAMLQYSSAHVSGLYNSGQKELTGLGIVVAVALILILVLVAVNWFGVLLFAAAGFHGSHYSSHGGFRALRVRGAALGHRDCRNHLRVHGLPGAA